MTPIMVPVRGPLAFVGATLVFATLAEPIDVKARERMSKAILAWVVRYQSDIRGKRVSAWADPAWSDLLQAIPAQQQRALLDRLMRRIEQRLLAARLWSLLQVPHVRVVRRQSRPPIEVQADRRWLRENEIDQHDVQAATSRKITAPDPLSINRLCADLAEQRGTTGANIKRDIWTATRPVLHLAIALREMDLEGRFPDVMHLVMQPDSWLQQFLHKAEHMADNWHSWREVHPALAKIDSSVFVRIRALPNS